MKSLYIHIPFCQRKCRYCDFNSYEGKEDQIEAYCQSVKEEIRSYGETQFHTIYFGGGTPSLLTPKQIETILSGLTSEQEITLEANPGTVTWESLQGYKKAGIHRLSLGLQATQNTILQEIGRIHTWEDFEVAYDLARKAGFTNINVDFMFGLPHQTLEDVKQSLSYLLSKQPDHISCYSLILHQPIFSDLPSEEEEREMYHEICHTLQQAGYEQYEISNFAKLGKASQHNLVYWNQEEYLGVGAGASSYVHGKRYTNVASIEEYCTCIREHKIPYTVEEVQGKEEEMREYMILRTRLLAGVQCKTFQAKFGQDPEIYFAKEIQKMQKWGLLEITEINRERWIRLTRKGLDLANLVWEEFV